MARPKDTAAVDLSQPQELTAGLIARLQCPADKAQAFLRDRKSPALRVRVTAAGAKSFVFEAKLGRQTIRRTIGDVRAWTIEDARAEANRQRVLIDTGTDPRELERKQTEERAAKAALDAAKSAKVREVWDLYLAERRPRWGELHYQDHVRKAKAGGQEAVRGTRGRGKTVAGPLYPLMEMRLGELTPAVVSEWAAREAATRPTAARLSWRLLRGFLNWCAERPEYAQVLPAQNPANVKSAREALGRPQVKQDALQREQLPAWFSAVRQLANPLHSAYLQTLLLTGARPSEVLTMRWQDIDFKWNGLTIRDKVEGERVIPLTPHVAGLLGELPRRGQWVFAGTLGEDGTAPKAMSTPHKQHEKACKVAGIEGLTLHGLRRSFRSLSEWQEIPAGVVAQLMGHKPSATAEKHYTVRPLDLLRLHHERIESWILQEAQITPSQPVQRPANVRRIK
jgi:integrase